MDKFIAAIGSFAREEEGAQVVEYALIIALVSIALALALAGNNGGIGTAFATLVTRLQACFATGAVTC